MNQSQKKLPKFLTMRELTKNEKRLLSILAIVLVGWGIYQFIIEPQSRTLQAFNMEKLEYQDKINEINTIILQEDAIVKDMEKIEDEKDEIASRYFQKLDQAQVTYLLNDLLAVNNLEILDITYDLPTYEDLEDFQVKKMAISVSYEGSYSGVLAMMKSLKNSPRKILVDSIAMDRQDGGSLTGNVSLKIYGLDHIVGEDEDGFMIQGEKRDIARTPFSAYSSYLENNEGISEAGASSEVSPLINPSNPLRELNPYSPGFSVDYEKENAISVIPEEELK